MGSIALPALAIRPPENPLDQYAKALSVKSMIGGQQIQQEQIKQSQIGTQGAGIELQMKQLALKNMQVTQSALAEPDLENQFKDWQGAKTSNAAPTLGTEAPLGVTLHPLAQFLAEKKGLPFMGPGGALELSNTLTKSAQDVATLIKTKGDIAKTQFDNHDKQLANFNDRAESVLAETDPAKQKTAIEQLKNEVLTNQDEYPAELVSQIGKVNSAGDLSSFYNSGKLHQMMIEEGKAKAEEQSAQATATQKTQAAAGIRDKDGAFTPQARTAMDTVKNYAVGSGGAIPAAMVAGLTKEMQNAPDVETLQKIQARADTINESFQRSADARAQANAIKDVGIQQVVAGKLVTEDQKLGTSLDQTAGIRGLLDMSKGGNQTATNAAQVRFAEHEIVEGGVKRMNQVELNALTSSLGTYGRQFMAWADKGFEGKMPPATNAEMQKILDAEDGNANTTHERNIGYITNRYTGVGKYSNLTQGKAPAQGVPGPGAAQFHYQSAKGEIFSNDGKTWYDAKGALIGGR